MCPEPQLIHKGTRSARARSYPTPLVVRWPADKDRPAAGVPSPDPVLANAGGVCAGLYRRHASVAAGGGARLSGVGGAPKRGGAKVAYELKAKSVEWNPPAKRLRELAEEMPNSQVTEFGNLAVKARVDSRSARSTYIVDDSSNVTKRTITRAEYDRVAAAQDAYIAGRDMVVVDGYICSDPLLPTRARP